MDDLKQRFANEVPDYAPRDREAYISWLESLVSKYEDSVTEVGRLEPCPVIQPYRYFWVMWEAESAFDKVKGHSAWRFKTFPSLKKIKYLIRKDAEELYSGKNFSIEPLDIKELSQEDYNSFTKDL